MTSLFNPVGVGVARALQLGVAPGVTNVKPIQGSDRAYTAYPPSDESVQ